MCQGRKSIHRLTVQQNIQLHQFGRAEAVGMIVKRGISLGDTLQFIIEIDDYFAKRHIIIYFHTVTGNIFLLHQLATLAQTKSHDRTDIISSGNHRGADIGLLNTVYHSRIRHAAGIMHLSHISLLVIDIVGNVGHGGDNIHVKFTVKAFLHNLHVEQSEKTTPETKAQS